MILDLNNSYLFCLSSEAASKRWRAKGSTTSELEWSQASRANLRESVELKASWLATLSEISEILESRWPAHRPRTKPAVTKLGSFARSTASSSKSKISSSREAAREAPWADDI